LDIEHRNTLVSVPIRDEDFISVWVNRNFGHSTKVFRIIAAGANARSTKLQ
jgi:hypothetical protein